LGYDLGPVLLRWVVTKTFSHTCEYIDATLKLSLFWYMVVQSLQATEA